MRHNLGHIMYLLLFDKRLCHNIIGSSVRVSQRLVENLKKKLETVQFMKQTVTQTHATYYFTVI